LDKTLLKDENLNILPGDDITIKYTLSGEELKNLFSTENKVY
jgi:hypothetical protein